MASSPISGPALRLAHRFRMRVGTDGSFQLLADLLGLSTRTLSRLEAWSGPTAAAMLLLGEAPARQVPELAATLLRSTGKKSPATLSALAAEVRDAPEGMTFAEALDRPMPWVYWATSARANPLETLRLATEEGIICRPLLETKDEVHGYLLAIRKGDGVLLAHDGFPLGWFQVGAGMTPPKGLTSRVHPALSELATPDDAGAEPLRMVDLLPRVFRYIDTGSALGTALASYESPYRLFDGKLARPETRSFFSALPVRKVHQKVPTRAELAVRVKGQRSRMTRYLGEVPAEP